jgi:mannose-6-phosphate isomerase-like protein (cupin superfamily)
LTVRPDTSAIVLQPGEGRAIDLGSFEMVVKSTGADSGGAFALLEASEPANFGPPIHIHHDCAEAFYVLEGEYRILVEEEEFRCGPGAFVLIPSGLRHAFRTGDVPSRKLNLYAPAEMVGYFDALAEAHARGEADTERLEDIARRHGMEVIGPVPEGYL